MEQPKANRGRIALALIAGVVSGAVLNGLIVFLGPTIIPPPAGADMTTAEGLAAAMPLLEPRHFIAPFLAHALGTFEGAFVGALLAPRHRALVAYSISGFFLIGGIAASVMIPAPLWFKALDLTVAYLPMAWLALKLPSRKF